MPFGGMGCPIELRHRAKEVAQMSPMPFGGMGCPIVTDSVDTIMYEGVSNAFRRDGLSDLVYHPAGLQGR